MAFSNYLNLTHGAGKLVEVFGTPEQKELFLEKLYTGTWGGTLCLTESDAGSDVGAIKTIAKRNSDGTYSIKGSLFPCRCFGDRDDQPFCLRIGHLLTDQDICWRDRLAVISPVPIPPDCNHRSIKGNPPV